MPPKSKQTQSTVSFYGEDIITVLELEPNEAYAIIGHLCERLGLTRSAQERRIKSHSVLREGARSVKVEVANGYETMLGLRVDLVPLWLVGVDAAQVEGDARARLELLQRESASLLWQAFKPQGFGSEDELLPDRYQQTPAEQAYVGAQGIATLARQQMLIERQLNTARAERDFLREDPRSPGAAVDDRPAAQLAQTVRRVAHTLAERTRRNEYAGIFTGLYRQFGITSYRRMPQGRLHEALEWLERWHGDILGEPEPPPDI